MDEGTSARMMTVRPVALNRAIASLFIVGSGLFVLGSVPGYANAVGASVDGITYFAGSIFFTAASFAQLLQAQRLRRGLPPSPNFLARCSSTSAPSRRWYAMPQ